MHVLYLDQAPAMELDNVAIAWDQGCSLCRSTAVSLQVAVVSGPGTVTANNRSVALNAACTSCAARSAAYQLVVTGDGQARLSATSLDALQAWATERAELLRQSPQIADLRTRVARNQDLDALEQLVDADLNANLRAAHARLSGR